MQDILLGAIAMASFVAGLFFLRFWKSTKDRFFLFFAIAFWIEAINRVILGLVELSENFPIFYLIRFLAFALILFAILDKNQAKKIL
ncbi:MAG: DUF5985 family protein [Candidatus Omnitrophica bacterium]|nr:DUF5985 family protein [Candidatus Omnitrophota bacterium]